MGQGVAPYIVFFSLAGESEDRASDTRFQPRGAVGSLVDSVVNDAVGVVDTLLGALSEPIESFTRTTPLPPASSPTTTPTTSAIGTSSSTPTSTPSSTSSQSSSTSQSSTVIGSSTSPLSSHTSSSTSVSSVTTSSSSTLPASQTTTSLSSTLATSSTIVSVGQTTSVTSSQSLSTVGQTTTQPNSVTDSSTGSTASVGQTTSATSSQSLTESTSASGSPTNSQSGSVTESATGSTGVSLGHTTTASSSIIQSTTGGSSVSVSQTTSAESMTSSSSSSITSTSLSSSVTLTTTSSSTSIAESMTSSSSSSVTFSSLSSSVTSTSTLSSTSTSLSHSSGIFTSSSIPSSTSTSSSSASVSLSISSSSQSLTTTASATASSLSTDSLSSAPPSTGAGTGRSSSSFSTGRSTVRTSQTRTASTEAPGSTSDIGTTPNGALPRQPIHLSTILSILLSLLFLIFLLGFIYLCRRRQFKRGMNIFGQRLELGETPGAWQRLSEAGGRNHMEHGDKNEMIPGKLEKRSMLTVAASVAGRVGLPANRRQNQRRSTANYIPKGRHNRSGSNDSESLREARIPFGAAFQSASSFSLDSPLTPPGSRSHSSSLLSSVPFTFYRPPATSSRSAPVLDVPITASNTGSHISDENAYFDSSNSTLDLGLELQHHSGSQRDFIPLLHDNLTNSSFLDVNGMGYIPVIRQNSMSDSYSRIDAYVPETPSGYSSTRTSYIGDSETNLPHNGIENASQVSRISQDSRNTQDTHDTQGSMNTTSSLSFARPTMVRSATSAEVPLITSTFHYSPDGDEDEDMSGGSHFTPNFQQQYPPMTEANAGSFFRSMEWRRRAAAYADRTGQRPSLMEVVEVHFASNTDSPTATRDGRLAPRKESQF